jgi:uncharacterized protein YjbI with pentapeptide repeats
MLKPTIFISYKREHPPTEAVVERLEIIFREAGYDVLRDIGIEPGRVWPNELYRWLMECSAAVTIIGPEAAQSEWCRREWWFLRERHRTTGVPLFPLSLNGNVESAGILSDIEAFDVSGDFESHLLSRLKGLRSAKPSAENYLAAHHAWLRWQFADAPLWGREPFSLRDIYSETDCGRLAWKEIVDEKTRRDPFKDDEENGGRHDLIGTVIDLFSDPAFRELVVAQGPPGCGKSAFTLRLANELLKHGMWPVLVRFRDFRLTTIHSANELIEDALRIGPVEEEPPRPDGSIISPEMLNQVTKLGKASVSRLVFILDGWDEVSLTGNTSYQAQLQSWLPRIREYFIDRPGPPVRLILTGRPSAEVRNSGILRRDTPLLTVRQLTPVRLKAFAEAIESKLRQAAAAGHKASWSLDLHRLESLFDQYENWFAAADKTKSNSMDVVGSPLLAYLTFRTLAEWTGDPAQLVVEPTALYKVLIDITIENAGKGLKEVEGTVHRGGEPLRRLLHRVASAITVLGGETASFAELSHRFEEEKETINAWRSEEGLRVIVDDATHDSVLHELVINFYFKGGNTNVGCEFLHKSFREYLFAEAVIEVLKSISEKQSGTLAAPKVEYWQDFPDPSPQFTASRSLGRLLSPQWLTGDVRTHLFWLLKNEIEAGPKRWEWICDLLLDVYIWWAEGIHLRPQPEKKRGSRTWNVAVINELVEHALPFDSTATVEPIRTVALDAHLGDALMQISAMVHAWLRGHEGGTPDNGFLRKEYRRPGTRRFRPGADRYFAPLCHRINAASWRPNGTFPADADLPAIDLDGQDCRLIAFHYTYLRAASLRDANLRGTVFDRVDLRDVDLAGANLRSARIIGCDLRRARLASVDLGQCQFQDASLEYADLHEANLQGGLLLNCELQGAHLTEINLAGSHLGGTRLAGAKLEGANLQGAILNLCDVSGAQLNNASLIGTHFRKTKLEAANLSDAILEDAILDHCVMIGARLTGANLHRSLLRETDLSGANLEGAILHSAILDRCVMSGAHLANVEFQGSYILETTAAQSDLEKAGIGGAMWANCQIVPEHSLVSDAGDEANG